MDDTVKKKEKIEEALDDKNENEISDDKEETEEIQEECESPAEKELEVLKEKLLRIAAEYDNYRKRTEKEKAQIRLAVVESFVMEFLPVIDSIEMAFDNLKSEDEACKKGMEMIKTQLSSALKKLNISSFGESGEEFNPELHSAISHIESKDNEKNIISNVFLKGYKYDQKVIRHATVQVTN